MCPRALSGPLAALAMGALACGSSGGGDAAGGGGSSGSATGASAGSGPAHVCNGEEMRSGEATYYDFADGSGNCGFDKSPEDLMIGAMNHDDYADSAACGACVELTGPNGALTIRVVDQCPECPKGDIDLSPDAFAKIADLSAGRVPISWQYAGCAVDGPIRYHFKEGSNPYWTAVQIRNHRYAVAKLEYQSPDGSWKAVERLDYNFFVEASGMGAGPYAFRVTDVYGQVLEDSGVPFVEAGDSPGKAQFPACE